MRSGKWTARHPDSGVSQWRRPRISAVVLALALLASACSSGGSSLTSIPEDAVSSTETTEPGGGVEQRVDESQTTTTVREDGGAVETTSTTAAASDGQPLLQPAVWPTAAPVDESTMLMVSVRPLTELAEAPTLLTLGTSTVMNDSGANGDIVAGDNIFSVELAFAPTEAGQASITVEADAADGRVLTGETFVTVTTPELPTSTESGVELNIVSDGGSEFLADRLIIIVADDFDPAGLASSVAPIDGTIVGFVGPGVWQVAVPAVTSLAEIEGYIIALAGQPGIIGAEPEFVESCCG